MHRFLPLLLVFASPWAVPELLVGMRHGSSSGGSRDEQEKGVQTDLVLGSDLNSELVKSNYVPMWGLDPVSPVCSLSGQQQMAREEPQPKNLSCIVTLWLDGLELGQTPAFHPCCRALA